jgi:adiponectin receptor
LETHPNDEDEMYLRKRVTTRDESPSNLDRLNFVDDDMSDALSEEEDNGCPLPSTPEDNQLLEAEVIFF